VGLQEVRLEGGGTEPAGDAIFYGKGNDNHELNTAYFFCIRKSYQQLKGLSLLVIGYHT
jgi:hypothetical protein